MSKKRLYYRQIKRLETIFTAGGVTRRGITSDVSEGGLFIRTRYGLVPGSALSIEIYLPDGTISKVKGIVKRSVRTPISTIKNGMGVEIIERDSAYMNLVDEIKSNDSNGGTSTLHKNFEDDFSILICSGCGVKNKVRAGATDLNPKCGKCGHSLIRQEKTSHQLEYLVLSCSNCKAKNKVASEKLSLNPRCGKCGTSLRPQDIV